MTPLTAAMARLPLELRQNVRTGRVETNWQGRGWAVPTRDMESLIAGAVNRDLHREERRGVSRPNLRAEMAVLAEVHRVDPVLADAEAAPPVTGPDPTAGVVVSPVSCWAAWLPAMQALSGEARAVVVADGVAAETWAINYLECFGRYGFDARSAHNRDLTDALSAAALVLVTERQAACALASPARRATLIVVSPSRDVPRSIGLTVDEDAFVPAAWPAIVGAAKLADVAEPSADEVRESRHVYDDVVDRVARLLRTTEKIAFDTMADLLRAADVAHRYEGRFDDPKLIDRVRRGVSQVGWHYRRATNPVTRNRVFASSPEWSATAHRAQIAANVIQARFGRASS